MSTPNTSVYVEESDCSNNTNETLSTATTTSEHRLRNKKKYAPINKKEKAEKTKKTVLESENSKFKYTFVGHIKVLFF